MFEDNRGNKFKIKGNMNCETENLIYGVKCLRCNNLLYIGETGGSLYQRHLLNLSRMRTGHNTDALQEHFRLHDHTVDDYKIIAIEKNSREEGYRR